MYEDCVWVDFNTMESFMVDVFKGLGVPEEDARICADVLITSDKRGIDSHGISRLKTIYYDRIRIGIQSPVTGFEIIREKMCEITDVNMATTDKIPIILFLN